MILDHLCLRRDEKSAKDLNRTGIQEIINDCQRKAFDMVIICKLDRMTRNVRELGYLVQDVFEKTGFAFSSIADNFDTTAANGKLVLNILGSVATIGLSILAEISLGESNDTKEQFWCQAGAVDHPAS